MRTKTYISAVALAAALMTPQLTLAQSLSVDVGGIDADVSLGGDSGLDADVSVGGDSGVDAGVSLGGDTGLDADVGVGGGGGVDAGVSVGGSDSGNLVDANVGVGSGSGGGDSLVGVDVGIGSGTGGTGPNGGALIDLNANVLDGAAVDADVELLGGGTAPATGAAGGSNLITGDVRIGALGTRGARTDGLLELIASPNLADIDLDAAIDDTRVSITSAADLLGSDGLADIQAAVGTGGAGRTELLDALSGSSELVSILGAQGIALEDVLAVQIAENGATEVIVLERTIAVALGGDNGDLANVGVADAAEIDIDLLSDEELAEIDLGLLPDEQRTTAQLRLLRSEGNLADLSVDQLANIDLDLLSDEELASLELNALPEELRTPIQLRLLANDGGNIADLSVGELANLSVSTQSGGDASSGDGDTGGSDTGNSDSNDGATDSDGGTGNTDTGDSTGGSNQGGTASASEGEDASDSASTGTATSANAGDAQVADASTVPVAAQAGATPGIAVLSCDIGVLALAKGEPATPAAISGAQSLELARIGGCEGNLADAQIDTIRSSVDANPAISSVLDGASIPLDQVIGATVQAGTLTLFISAIPS